MADSIAAPNELTTATQAHVLPTRRAVWSWALYDLANVNFFMNILSLYFPLWVVNDKGGSDADYGLANSL